MRLCGCLALFPVSTLLIPLITVTLAGAIAARQNYTDADIIKFLTNVECVTFTSAAWTFFVCVCDWRKAQGVCVPALVLLSLLIIAVRTVM